MKRSTAHSSDPAGDRLQDLLIGSLDRSLTPAEEVKLLALLATSVEARTELRRLRRLRDLARDSRRESFAYGFSDRVMQRLRPADGLSGFDTYVQELLWSFRHVTVTAGIIALTMAAYTFAASTNGSSLISSLGASSHPASASAAIDLMEVP